MRSGRWHSATDRLNVETIGTNGSRCFSVQDDLKCSLIVEGYHEHAVRFEPFYDVTGVLIGSSNRSGAEERDKHLCSLGVLVFVSHIAIRFVYEYVSRLQWKMIPI